MNSFLINKANQLSGLTKPGNMIGQNQVSEVLFERQIFKNVYENMRKVKGLEEPFFFCS